MLVKRTVQTVDARAFFFIRHSSYLCASFRALIS
jgi:hypothetical protein